LQLAAVCDAGHVGEPQPASPTIVPTKVVRHPDLNVAFTQPFDHPLPVQVVRTAAATV
jgi:hypothetical protein